MSQRKSRIEDFELFQGTVEKAFKSLQNQNPDYSSLVDYYGFTVCPKGRDGGQDPRHTDIFYGNRVYDQEKELTKDFKVSTHFLSESGAELSFFRDDFGYVCVQLFPAKSKYGRQYEDSILLYAHYGPRKLLKHSIQKKILKQLNSYMAVTCLEGKPSCCDKARVFFMRLNKRMVVKEEIQPVRIMSWLGEVLKFALTVGLSGFLLTIIEKYV